MKNYLKYITEDRNDIYTEIEFEIYNSDYQDDTFKAHQKELFKALLKLEDSEEYKIFPYMRDYSTEQYDELHLYCVLTDKIYSEIMLKKVKDLANKHRIKITGYDKLTDIQLTKLLNNIGVTNVITEEDDSIQTKTYSEFVDGGGTLEEVNDFYNHYFPKSKNTVDYKRKKYAQPDSLIYINVRGKLIVGLLESWITDDVRYLVTAVTDEEHQGKGLFRQNCERLFKESKNENIILHFRHPNKDKLMNVYARLGFTDLKEDGQYQNGDKKWGMTYYA